MDWYDFIKQKYDVWSDNGKRSENQFAVWLGISQSTVNGWLTKAKGAPDTQRIVSKLAAKYPEVYEVLGLEPPEDSLSGYPPRIRRLLKRANAEINLELKQRGLTSDSPEGEALTISIMERYGFKLTNIENLPD